MSFMETTTDNKSSFLFLVNVNNKKGSQRIFSPASNNIFSFSQVIYQLRLPGDYKFFTFKGSVNVAIYIYICANLKPSDCQPCDDSFWAVVTSRSKYSKNFLNYLPQLSWKNN